MKDLSEFSANDLLVAYTIGIFPMAKNSTDLNVSWVCPEKRGIIPINGLHISRSLKRKILSKKYRSSFNTSFEKIVLHCRDRKETWINETLFERYLELYERKFAHSVEIWYDDKIVGGLFGISIGACFFAESMFSLKSDGSKLALVALFNRLKATGFELFDTQFYTQHLGSLGAKEISKNDYELKLRHNLNKNTNFFVNNPEKEFLFYPE